jgi:galactose-1-phosphate uridylyltransferase
VAFVGIGHLYPAIEVWAKRAEALPWELTPDELDGWADILHAVHVATGPAVPTNEEWHYRPPEVSGRIPLRAVVKWRINTPAGFEGGTKIHINTIDPWTLRDRVVAALDGAAAAGALAGGLRIIHS